MTASLPLRAVLERLSAELRGFAPGAPVAYTYNPLDYARRALEEYLGRYALPPRRDRDRVLLVGMNPGPWGMAQTGVPFGTVSRVRDWLGIETEIGKPRREHPKKRVEGFACRRQEVSGDRLWGFAKERFGTPERFFRRFFVWNYCPLLFLDEGGRNLTPDRLAREDRTRLLEPCDRALRAAIEELEVVRVIGIGAFAEGRARRALEGFDLPVSSILHPSPASPAANRGWAEQAAAQLEGLGIRLPS